MIRAALRLLAALADRLLAPPDWTWSYQSWSDTDSRRGGESRTPTPLAVPANRPGGCKPSP